MSPVHATQSFLGTLGIHIELYRYMLVGGLIFTRIFILVMFLPYFGRKPIPGRVRIALTLALTLVFYTPVAAMTTGAIPTSAGIIFALFLKEVLFAILIGLAAGMVFYGIQAAGGMIDNQRMLANAQIFNPAMGSQASLFGIFFYQLSIVVFLLMGGHHILLKGLGNSFSTVPLLTLPTIGTGITPVLEFIIRLAADTLVIALQLAAPVLIAIFIADIILGLTNRVAPMVNVFEMGFNIKGYLGVLLVYLSLPLVIYQMKVWFVSYMETFNRMIDFFLR